MCYYYEGEHYVRDCKKFTKGKAKYKLKTMDLAKKYKDKFRQAAKKGISQSARYPVLQSQLTQWNKWNSC